MTSSHFRRTLTVLFILVLTSTLTGCVYLRLLKVKRQLRDFERYVKIDERNGLTLLLNKPVLKEADVVWLLEGEAAIQARNGRYTLLKYDFKKHVQDSSSEGSIGAPIAVSLHFEDGKLYKLRFPREFSRHLKPALLQGSLQSMGKGSVSKQGKSVSATMQIGEHIGRQEPQIPLIPTKSEVKRILGSPSYLTEMASSDMFYYQYTIGITQEDTSEPLPMLRVWLHFSPEDDKLRVAKASFHGMSTTISYQ